MSRSPKPYIKCERRGEMWHLTLMRSTGRNLTLAGRGEVAVDDWFGLQQEVIKIVDAARLAEQRIGIQADGDS